MLLAAAMAVSGMVAVATPSAAQAARCFGRDVTITAVVGQVTEGTPGPDVIKGTAGPDVIRGLGGGDRICAGGGDDTVLGGAGNDRINLGKGNDTASGGGGADLIVGKGGADEIAGNGGGDDLRGGGGADTIIGGKNADRIQGGGGADDLRGNGGPDIIGGGPGNDRCAGGPGNNQLSSCNEMTSFTAGQYRVGVDIAPGRYKFANARAGCFWERLSGFSGELSDTLSNDFQPHDGPAVIDILTGDRGFEFDADCGTLRPYRAPSRPATTFGPGGYVVGADIRPGTYTAQADDGCFWRRSSGFTNELRETIANDFVADGGQVVVSIEASDAGFYADGDCGTWSRTGA